MVMTDIGERKKEESYLLQIVRRPSHLKRATCNMSYFGFLEYFVS